MSDDWPPKWPFIAFGVAAVCMVLLWLLCVFCMRKYHRLPPGTSVVVTTQYRSDSARPQTAVVNHPYVNPFAHGGGHAAGAPYVTDLNHHFHPPGHPLHPHGVPYGAPHPGPFLGAGVPRVTVDAPPAYDFHKDACPPYS